jgi:S-DNA-T family DNA segregation ATPase FtsK/SpoIIIE
MVGAIGTMFGHFNQKLFGFIGYLYPFFLIFPAYLIYKNSRISEELMKFSWLGGVMLFALLLFQAKIFPHPFDGLIGSATNSFLKSYIGDIGIWLFIISALALSVTLMANASFEEISDSINIRKEIRELKERLNNFLFPKDDYLEIENQFLNSRKRVTIDEDSGDEIDSDFKSEYSVKSDPDTEPKDEEGLTLKKISSISELLSIESSSKIDESIKQIEREAKELEGDLSSKYQVEQEQKPSDKTESVIPKRENIIAKEVETNSKILKRDIKKGSVKKPKNFKLPYLDFLKSPPKKRVHVNESEIDQKIENLIEKLKQFKITGDVVRTYSGPVVTTFEFRPDAHIKVSKILTLQDDLAMALKAETIRIQAPIPGKDVVGIEIPNRESQTIYLKEILSSELFKKSGSPLTIALGKDIVGNPFVTDLKILPHLLIAGTTGSGKSVGVNSMLVSLLYKNSPDDLKLLMIDPKMLEFSIYNDIPHLLTPVITDPKKAVTALSNMVLEMEKRYKLMSNTKTKNIENYNEKAIREGREPFPYIVIIIDELADLMMTSGKDVEFYIARLAQMARASGIHIIVATQRPSVDVVTGLIKANLPSRISFKVGQKVDSKIILDTQGAESLLGRGDMLFTPPGSSSIIRLHAPFITEEEIEQIVEFLKVQREVVYDPSYLSESVGEGGSSTKATNDKSSATSGEFDPLFEEAKSVILSDKKTSISYLQRRLQIGYNRSATIIEQLEMAGVLSAPNAKGQREILIDSV